MALSFVSFFGLSANALRCFQGVRKTIQGVQSDSMKPVHCLGSVNDVCYRMEGSVYKHGVNSKNYILMV